MKKFRSNFLSKFVRRNSTSYKPRSKLLIYSAFGFIGGILFSYISLEEQEEYDNFTTIIDNQLWTYTHYYQIKNIFPMNISENMCIIKLLNGEILLYNPVHLTQNIRMILNVIENKNIHIIIPKLNKTNSVIEYIQEYPNLNLYVLEENEKEVYEILKDSKKFNLNLFKKSPWKDIIFEKIDGLNQNELILYHKPSKMLLTCESTQNITKETAKKNRLGFSYFTLFKNSSEKFENFNLKFDTPIDFEKYKNSLEKIGNEYDFNGIFMSIGTPINPFGELDLRAKWKEDLKKLK